MTWVVAGRHAFCCRALSDVCVTLRYASGESRHIDAVRKVHVLTPRVTILFADSIRLAFAIIESLRGAFIEGLDDRLFERPELIIHEVSRRIRWAYGKFRRTGESVQFILLVIPTGVFTPFGVAKLCSPRFEPQFPTEAFEMLEIGSGSVVNPYRDIIKTHSVGILTVEDPDGGAPIAILPMGRELLRSVFVEALDFQAAGVSHAMHITLQTPEATIVETLPAGPDLEFPVVAHNWRDLVALLKSKGIPNLSSAKAIA